MSNNYIILSNDDTTHLVVVRVQDGDWTQGANFRDEVYDLNMVVPGAAQTFALMKMPFDYTAALNYLEGQLQFQIDNGIVHITPPNWDASVNGRFAQTCDYTPKAYIPAAPQPATEAPSNDPS